MLKKTFRTVCLTVATVLLCFSFGCSNLTELSFNNSYAGGKDITNSQSQELSYSVNYDTEYFKLNGEIDKSVLEFNFEEGEYTWKFSVCNVFPQETTSDLKNHPVSETAFIFKTESLLIIPVTYKIFGEEYPRTDTIKTTTWFYYGNMSFAPICAKTQSDYALLYYNSNDAEISIIKTESETTYNSKDYTVFNKYETYNKSGEKVSENQTSDNYSYDFKTVIDNTQLLFALRNMDIKVESEAYLPVVSSNYGSYKSIKISNKAEFDNFEINLNYNGTAVSERIKVKEYSFTINSDKTSGLPQYLFIQNGTTENISDNYSLPFRYVEPITCYGAYFTIGALRYDLKSVNIG